MRKISPTLILVSTLYATTLAMRPKYIECQDSMECPVGFCCRIGMGKFSIPRCQPMSEIGENCYRNEHEAFYPHNLTLNYPDGQRVELTNVFYMNCPCEVGLYCNHHRQCADPYEDSHTKFNSIDSFRRK